jgi:hypothetical protein
MTTHNAQTVNKKRLVLFAGPHKSASSSVQELFSKHASSNRKRKHPALNNWTWPFTPRVRSYLPRKGFAPLVTEYDNKELRDAIYNIIHSAWNSNKSSSGVIFGSEEFDRVGSTPWSHRNGMLAIRDILEFLKPEDFQIVVNYRTPRNEQWISIWKQLTRTRPIPYRDYLCKEDVRTWEYLDSVANPLGLVQAFRSNNLPVKLIDLGGVTELGLDVAHVIACEILKVPCVGGWLEGLEQILQNKKMGDPEISEKQVREMEWIFRQRDCAYQAKLQADDGIEIFHRHSLWEDCPTPAVADFANTTFLLNLLRAQIGCGDGSVNASDWIPRLTTIGQNGGFELKPGVHSAQDHASTDDLQEIAKMQHYLLFSILCFMVSFLVRRLKWRKVRRRHDV